MFYEAQTLTPDSLWARKELQTRFLKKREVIETLCAPLSVEDHIVSSTSDTSPPKWHLAHTSWFYDHFILKTFGGGLIQGAPYEYLFNSYYQAIGEFLPKAKRGFLSRPSLEEINDYRIQVNERILDLIESCSQEVLRKIAPLIELGIHHEQQHQELLLMDIKQNFFQNPLLPTYAKRNPHAVFPVNQASESPFLSYSGGLTKIGNSESSFHYDNEGGRHTVWIEPFQLSANLVTNGEFLEFIELGGYEDPKYWLSDGWDLIQKNKWEHPEYWIQKQNAYQEMTLSGVRPLDLDSPVSHVSYYEAQAFARFHGARLPTEQEWEYAASSEPVFGNFMEEGQFHPVASPDLHGNLWEWTQSAYLPYPGYRSFENGLAEYNSKFMCNQFVLRGGSCVTPRSHYRLSYRNFYYPNQRWQFSGFRLAKDGA